MTDEVHPDWIRMPEQKGATEADMLAKHIEVLTEEYNIALWTYEFAQKAEKVARKSRHVAWLKYMAIFNQLAKARAALGNTPEREREK